MALLVLLLTSQVRGDRDTAPGAPEIAALAQTLSSLDPQARERAFSALRSLGEDALPAIDTRIQQLAAQLDPAAAADALTAFRRIQGASAPNADVDLAQGVLPVLANDHGRGARQAAELLALLRSLEAQQTPRAAEVALVRLLGVDPKLFRFEARRTVARFGIVALPALVLGLNHPRTFIRDLSKETLVALHLDTPGRAVQQDDVTLLAALLDAYGETLTFDAMPVICSYLTDERVAVAEAAQRAIRRFRKNAIWQLREVYRNATGSEAPASFGSERLLNEIVALHAAPKAAEVAKSIDEAKNALASSDLDRAAIALDRALSIRPDHQAVATAGPLYAELAEGYLRARSPRAALAAARRARRLSAKEEPVLLARLEYLEAEARAAEGVLDLDSYDRATALDPTFTQAATTRDEVSGARAARARRLRHVAGLIAAALLLIAGFVLLRAGQRKVQVLPPAS